MGNEMGNNNSTSDQFQEEEKPVQQPVVSGNDDRISLDGALGRGNGGKGGDFVVHGEDSRSHGNGTELGSDEPEATVEDGEDHEEEEEEEESQKQVPDGLPTAESPETDSESDDDETTRSTDSDLQSSGSTEEPEHPHSDLVELQEPFKQDEAERLTTSFTDESANRAADETRSKDCSLEPHSLSEESEQHNLDLVEEQESFKQAEEAEVLNSTSIAESLETNPESDKTRSKDNNLQSGVLIEEAEQLNSDLVEEQEPRQQEEAEMLNSSTSTTETNLESDEKRSKDNNILLGDLIEEAEELTSDLIEEQEPCKQEEAEMLNSTCTAESLQTYPESDETRSQDSNLQPNGSTEVPEELNSDLVDQQEACKQVDAEIPNSTTSTTVSTSPDEEHPINHEPELELNQNEGNSTSTILSPSQDEEHPDSYEPELKLDQNEGITTESSTVDIAGLENGHHLDAQTSHNPDEVLVPENIIKEMSLANQTIYLPAETATEEESETTVVNGNYTRDQESENGSQIDCSIVPEYESIESLNEADSEEQNTEVPELGISTTGGSNKEQDSESIKQKREASEIVNGGEETDGKEEFEPESLPVLEKKTAMETGDSHQDSSSNSSWDFNPGIGTEFFPDLAPTFVADQQEPVVPFPIQLPVEVPAMRVAEDQQLERMSTDSAPDNFVVNSKMQKSPSFNLHIRLQSTEDYSDQTPLLQQYQDKKAIIPPTKQTQTVEPINYAEAMPVDEKVIQTLERGDSEKSLILGWGNSNGVPRHNSRASKEESAAFAPSNRKGQKHYSRRRPTIFGSFLCCTTTTAIN